MSKLNFKNICDHDIEDRTKNKWKVMHRLVKTKAKSELDLSNMQITQFCQLPRLGTQVD